MNSVPLIVLFDGHCGLCERSVGWLIRRDRHGVLLLAKNDGVTARIAGEPTGGEASGIVVLDGSRRLVGAPALARTLRALGGIWKIAGWVLDTLPRPLAGTAYSWIAGNRQSVSNLCDLQPEGRLEILD